MTRNFAKVLSEPLVHFLLAGFLLYLYYGFKTSDSGEEEKIVVNVSSSEVGQIKSKHRMNWNQDLNDEFLKALIAKKHYEKILLQEAFALELEKTDEAIQKRLLNRMKFLLSNKNELLEPSEEKLREYYLKNIDDYSVVRSITFSHIYFSDSKNKKIKGVDELLKTVDVDQNNAAYFSEEFRPSNYVENATLLDVEKQYGKYFTTKLSIMKSRTWHDLINSKLGVHFVYVETKRVGDPYEFDEVQDRVYEDYLREYRRSGIDEAYESVSAKYSLKVE